MVTQPAVLVVGAGGSQDYGFPSGTELVRIIVEGIRIDDQGREPNPSTELSRHLLDAGLRPRELNRFRDSLSRSQLYSVDAFLEQHEESVEVGKVAIAAVLGPIEDGRKLFFKGGWYRYLLNQLVSNLSAGAKQPLTIVTYNYDRSLEHYLYTALTETFGTGEDRMNEIRSNLSVIHVHGSLGALPWQTGENPEGRRPYGESIGGPTIKAAAANITIIHESQDGSPPYQQARDRLAGAKRVCFLGFGYHRINVRRLAVGSWKPSKDRDQVIGSAFNLTDAEKRQRLEYCEGGIKLGDTSWDCERFLREHVWAIS